MRAVCCVAHIHSLAGTVHISRDRRVLGDREPDAVANDLGNARRGFTW